MTANCLFEEKLYKSFSAMHVTFNELPNRYQLSKKTKFTFIQSHSVKSSCNCDKTINEHMQIDIAITS